MIVVKKRLVISPPPVVDKTEAVAPSVPEVAALAVASDSGLAATIPDARHLLPERKRKEDHLTGLSESTGHGR
ncbi:hypothetical protein Q0T61_20580 [Escherichia coli O156:H5]|nr:hypothetical protein [Escherichia coli O11:H15]EII3576273.1 hypothetical protein [Escherichia coli]HCD8863996.1 hypothetical protein [Escherichia coli]